MNRIQALSIDCHWASLEQREALSFTETQVREKLCFLGACRQVEEAVLLSTCNRTELYLCCDEGCDIKQLLCQGKMAGTAPDDGIFKRYEGESAVRHIMEVACGLCSQILCEDQIITQVKTAASIAREEHASGPVLESLFRLAVTAAKKAKTEIPVQTASPSLAHGALKKLSSLFGQLAGKRALVIGNGEMGRLCANLLRDAGCAVTVTLRTYKHGETIVPYGCKTVDYQERAKATGESDMVISATKSPHYTIHKAMLEGLGHIPPVFVDLAVPRDIAPDVQTLHGTVCLNVDDIGVWADEQTLSSLEKIRGVIAQYEEQFKQWLEIHRSAGVIQSVKRQLTQKVTNTLLYKEAGILEEDPLALIEMAVSKTVDNMVYAAKEGQFGDFIRTVDNALRQKQEGNH